jgi:hypothetical protein
MVLIIIMHVIKLVHETQRRRRTLPGTTEE